MSYIRISQAVYDRLLDKYGINFIGGKFVVAQDPQTCQHVTVIPHLSTFELASMIKAYSIYEECLTCGTQKLGDEFTETRFLRVEAPW